TSGLLSTCIHRITPASNRDQTHHAGSNTGRGSTTNATAVEIKGLLHEELQSGSLPCSQASNGEGSRPPIRRSVQRGCCRGAAPSGSARPESASTQMFFP